MLNRTNPQKDTLGYLFVEGRVIDKDLGYVSGYLGDETTNFFWAFWASSNKISQLAQRRRFWGRIRAPRIEITQKNGVPILCLIS